MQLSCGSAAASAVLCCVNVVLRFSIREAAVEDELAYDT